jgi:hypothetical protein
MAILLFIRNTRDFSNISTLIHLFQSFVRSKLEYASIVWFPHHAVHIPSIEHLQRRFLKYLCFREDGRYPPIGYSQTILLERLSFKTLSERNKLMNLLFLYKILHNLINCFDCNIIKSLKLKDAARKRYKTSGSTVDCESFKAIRCKLKTDIRTAYSSYIKRMNSDIRSNPRQFWAFIENKRKSNFIPSVMTYQSETITGPQEIVNGFADHFSKFFTPAKNNTYVPPASNNTFSLASVTEEQVLTAIRKLKPNMTQGHDQIPAFLVRDCACVFVEPLAIIFNLILKSCQFPEKWKYSKICPVYKKGVKKDICNYRPISIIPNLAKVFEYLLFNFFSFNVHPMISSCQHGFVGGRSTVTNLCTITEFLSGALDERRQVDVIYTDFSSAFDSIDHDILFKKLDSFGFSDNLRLLLRSYLHDRYLYVYLNGFKSYFFRQDSGVPQGLVLGPLFFNIYINDIVESLDLPCLLFADDMKVYSLIGCYDDALRVQDGIDSIVRWCVNNNLHLNCAKCKVVSFTKKTKPLLFNYNINGRILSRSNLVRDLGVIFDSRLSFTDHIESIVNSSFKSLGFVLRNGKEFSDVDTLKLLYFTCVRSRLEYASLVWSPMYNNHIASLERVQRRFLKNGVHMLTGSYPPRGHPNDLLLGQLGMSSLLSRRAEHSLVFLFKLIHGLVNCSDLLSQVTFKVNRPACRTKSTFSLPTRRTNTGLSSPVVRMMINYGNIEDRVDIFCCGIDALRKCYLNPLVRDQQ